jgi:Flp pilus assembly protein TadD
MGALGASYMEVAVFYSRFKVLGGLLAAGIGAGLLVGCAEPLTYSHDFKREGFREFNQGDYVNAAGTFKAAARQDPTDYQTQYYLGLSLERNGDYDTAIAAYRLCLKLRPQMPAGRMDIGMRERCTARLASVIAKESFADTEIDAIEREAAAERSAQDYRLVARIFALRGDADSAVDNYRHAMAVSDDDFILTKEYGLYLVKINQTVEAAAVLKKAWKLDPSDRVVASNLRGLGVTDAQLVVSSTTIEEPAQAPPSGSAWDSVTAPRD